MSSDDQLTYLYSELDKQLNKRKKSSQYWRKRNIITALITTALGALITILAGLETSCWNSHFANNVILIMGALVTITSSWGYFYSPKLSWILEGEAHDKLRALKAEIQFEEKADFYNKKNDRVKHFFERYQKTIAEYNRNRRNLRKKYDVISK